MGPDEAAPMAIELLPLQDFPSDWDQRVQAFASKTLFHERCWLQHVASIHPAGRIQLYQLQDGGGVMGYFPGIRVRKALVTLFGSPLPGTGTNYLGPLLAEEAAVPEVIEALFRRCRRERVMHLELAHPWLDRRSTRELGLESHPGVTHIVPLPSSQDAAWASLKSTCRNRVRKAEKGGLVCELAPDISVVQHFHQQYVEVYAKQGLAIPFGIERPRSLYQNLLPAGRLLPLWVKYQNEIVAAGLFPYDQHAIYFWGAASWMKYQHLCPNELLHWTVIRLAIEKGIPSYNMCGGTSQFKDKFGGSDVPYVRYSKSFLPGLSQARQIYEWLHRAGLRLRGALRGQRSAPLSDVA